MRDNERILLAAIHSIQQQNADQAVEPDEISGVAKTFGIEENRLVSLATEWQKDGLVEIQWGGKLSLTRTGRDILEGNQSDQTGGNITLNVGGDVTANNLAVGHGAQAGDKINISGSMIGDLAAALAELRGGGELLPQEIRARHEELVNSVAEVVEESSKVSPDQSLLQGYLEKAAKLAKSFTNMVETAEGLGTALGKVITGLKVIGTACGLASLF